MSLISNLVPLNLDEQKKIFWERDGDYNPQFVYAKDYSAKVLTKYGMPNQREYERAQSYLIAHPLQVSTDSGAALTFTELEVLLRDLCVRLAIAPITLVKSRRQNSRFMMRDQHTLSVQWPAKVSQEQFVSVLNHEIQTHLLRRLNDEKQPWHEQTRQRQKLWKKTEEGLAIYNSKDKNDPDLRQAALLYSLVYLAQTVDFKTVYHQNLRLGVSPTRAFTNSLRVKRGVRDTSRPGGFTKDLVYWEGYHQVAAYLRDPTRDIRDLYWGKVGLEEIEDLRAQAVTANLVYPTFVTS